MKNLADRLASLLVKAGKEDSRLQLIVFLCLVSPVVLTAGFSYLRIRQDLTQVTLSRRESIAYLAATTLKKENDNLTALGVSLATRIRFRQLTGEEKRDHAMGILKDVPKEFPRIERLFPNRPRGDPNGGYTGTPWNGKSFAFRDWYRA